MLGRDVSNGIAIRPIELGHKQESKFTQVH